VVDLAGAIVDQRAYLEFPLSAVIAPASREALVDEAVASHTLVADELGTALSYRRLSWSI
jgi:hypothetical protein